VDMKKSSGEAPGQRRSHYRFGFQDLVSLLIAGL
jgi:hypothetical protein